MLPDGADFILCTIFPVASVSLSCVSHSRFKEEGVLGAWGGVSGPYLCGRELMSPELAAGVRAEGSFAGSCTLHVLSELETAAHQLTAEQ